MKKERKMTYKILDLFSGLGGFSLGLERTGHFKTIAFCDNDKFSKLILDKHWKGVKIYDDVREISKEKFREDGIEFPDIITGGFPCQPFSVAGKQKGTSDDRHLWPEMFRIIKALKPRIVVGENVRGIVNIQDGMVFETVCTNLEDEGYEVQAFNIPAAGVGAPHRRERIWIIATLGDPKYDGPLTDEIGRRNEEIDGGTEKRQNNSFEFERTSGREDNENLSINVANTNDEGLRTRIGGSDDDHAKESRNRGTDGGRSTSDDDRHNTTSTTNATMDVANTESFRSRETRYSDQEEGSEGSRATQLNGTVEMWPTPTVNDSKNNAGPSQFRRKGTNLNVAVAKRGADGGKLNPTWVEWLMGYQEGYTDLKDWEILSSHKSSKKSAKR